MGVDRNKLAKRVSEIGVALSHLRAYGEMGAQEFIADIEKSAAAKYHLLTAIEACLSICSHLAVKVLRSVPEGYGSCFALLARNRIVEQDLADRLGRMTGFRNLLVHQYWEVDDNRVHRFIVEDLDDLEMFADTIGQFYLI